MYVLCCANGPIVWRNPTNHISNCYFCMTPPVSKGLSRKKKHGIQYPNIPSAIRPVPLGEILLVSKAPKKYTLDSDKQEIESSASSGKFPMSSQESYIASCISHELHFISQDNLNDFVRDLELSKTKSELLGLRLQQWNLLADGVRIFKYRDRQQAFKLVATKFLGNTKAARHPRYIFWTPIWIFSTKLWRSKR